jgi:hypothetical protein
MAIENVGPGGVGNSYGGRITKLPKQIIGANALKPNYDGFTQEDQYGAVFADKGNGDYELLLPDGSVAAIVSGVDLGPALSANGTAYTGSGYLDGWSCTAYDGGPQTVTISEGTSSGGSVIAVFNISGTGVVSVSPGGNSRIRFTTGLYATFAGGTSRTGRVMVEPA